MRIGCWHVRWYPFTVRGKMASSSAGDIVSASCWRMWRAHAAPLRAIGCASARQILLPRKAPTIFILLLNKWKKSGTDPVGKPWLYLSQAGRFSAALLLLRSRKSDTINAVAPRP